MYIKNILIIVISDIDLKINSFRLNLALCFSIKLKYNRKEKNNRIQDLGVMINNKRKKICLISSSGGHFEQLMKLDVVRKEFTSFVVTEKTKYNSNNPVIKYYLKQINRTSLFWVIPFFLN